MIESMSDQSENIAMYVLDSAESIGMLKMMILAVFRIRQVDFGYCCLGANFHPNFFPIRGYNITQTTELCPCLH